MAKEKPPILGLLQRGGEVVVRMLANVQQATIRPVGQLTAVLPGIVEERREHHRRQLDRHAIDPIEGLVARQTSLVKEVTRFWSGAWLADAKPKAKAEPKRRR